jgi:hypothetical protein
MADKKRHGRSASWRKAHSAAMRLHQNALKRGREIAARKTPTMTQFKKRAQLMAMARLRMKFAGTKGKSYKNLTSSQKIQVDDMVAKNINSKVVAKLAKSLIPKVRAAAAKKDPVVHPQNHSDRTIKESRLKKMMRARASRQRNRARYKTADVAKSKKEGGSKTAHSRHKSSRVTKTTEDNYARVTTTPNPWNRLTKLAMMASFRGKHTTAKKLEKISGNRIRQQGRMSSTSNQFDPESKQYNLRTDIWSDINTIVDVLSEDVVQDKIESLFIRGLVPKHQIQRYKRVLNDPKRYIKFRQYHDEILSLFRTFMEYLTSDG